MADGGDVSGFRWARCSRLIGARHPFIPFHASIPAMVKKTFDWLLRSGARNLKSKEFYLHSVYWDIFRVRLVGVTVVGRAEKLDTHFDTSRPKSRDIHWENLSCSFVQYNV